MSKSKILGVRLSTEQLYCLDCYKNTEPAHIEEVLFSDIYKGTEHCSNCHAPLSTKYNELPSMKDMKKLSDDWKIPLDED